MQGIEEHELALNEPHLPLSAFISECSKVDYHWHKFIELLYLYKGEATLRIDNELYNIKKGDFLLVNYAESHGVEEGKDSSFLVIQFKPALVNPNISSLYEAKFFARFLQKELSYVKLISLKDENELLNLLQESCEDFIAKTPGYQLNIKGNIYKIFATLIREQHITVPTSEKMGTGDVKQLVEVIKYVEANYKEKITDQTASRIAYMSYYHFCRVFKMATGRTFVEYLNFVRLMEADKLIVNTKRSISEIALEVGFSSSAYFNRLFKKERGITPLAYRNKAK